MALLGFSVKLTNLKRCATFDEVGQRTALVNLLIQVEHQFAAVEHSVLEIIRKLDGIEVAGVRTELAEHAVAQVSAMWAVILMVPLGQAFSHNVQAVHL